jgi:hypothetical protein
MIQRKANVLSKVGRPDIVDRWIANARKSTPQVSDVAAFGREWKAWWIGLQPEAREHEKLLRIAMPGERWEDLRKGGINGFFNVVVSLSWWCSAVKTAAQKKLLAVMADDVAWVLTQMIGSVGNVEKPGKRSLENEKDGVEENIAKRCEGYILRWILGYILINDIQEEEGYWEGTQVGVGGL